MSEFSAEHPDPGARSRYGDEGRLPVELRSRGRGAAPPLREGAEAQWIAERDLDWDRPIDHAKFATTPLGAALPIEQTSYWKSLAEETRLGAHPPHGGVSPEQLPARRAGRADGGGAAGQRGAAHRRQVLRRHADDGRGAARRGVRPIHPEARQGAPDRAAGEAHPRRDAADRRLAEEAGRHADRRRGPGALQLPRDAQRSPRSRCSRTCSPTSRATSRAITPTACSTSSAACPVSSDAQRTELEDFALEAARTLIDKRNQQTLLTLGHADLVRGRHRRRRAVRLHRARARRADQAPARTAGGSARCRASSSRRCAAAAC